MPFYSLDNTTFLCYNLGTTIQYCILGLVEKPWSTAGGEIPRRFYLKKTLFS